MSAEDARGSAAALWRAVVSTCQELSAETSTAALLPLAATRMRELASARYVSVLVREPSGGLVLGAQAGEPVPGADVLSFPLVSDGASRGVVHVAGAVVEETSRAGLEAVAAQLAIGLRHATIYEDLERLVEREMSAAVERQQAIQLVLDSMADGLLVCDLEGRITPIHSKAVTEWFGEPDPGATAWTYLGGGDPIFSSQLEFAFEEIAADVLPFDANALHVPKLLRRAGRVYALEPRQVFVEGRLAQVALMVTDVTDALATEELARAARELPEIIGHLLRDRDGFKSMMAETERLLGELGAEASPVTRARILHTLKGNSGIWGFSTFAYACHELEESLDGGAGGLEAPRLSALTEAWESALRPVRVLVDIDASEGAALLRISREEHERLLERLDRRDEHAAIAAMVGEWTRPPMHGPFDTLARQTEHLAARLGKRVRVVVDVDGRMPGPGVVPLVATLVHVVRNALAHGVEAPEERVTDGKEPEATLRISATTAADALEVVLEDDGRGVDWEGVRARARELGLACETEHDVHEALFADTLTTARHASMLSGRGVGVGAVRDAFRRAGGDVRIESSPGRGTRVVARASIVRLAAGA